MLLRWFGVSGGVRGLERHTGRVRNAGASPFPLTSLSVSLWCRSTLCFAAEASISRSAQATSGFFNPGPSRASTAADEGSAPVVPIGIIYTSYLAAIYRSTRETLAPFSGLRLKQCRSIAWPPCLRLTDNNSKGVPHSQLKLRCWRLKSRHLNFRANS